SRPFSVSTHIAYLPPLVCCEGRAVGVYGQRSCLFTPSLGESVVDHRHNLVSCNRFLGYVRSEIRDQLLSGRDQRLVHFWRCSKQRSPLVRCIWSQASDTPVWFN